jgi:hypothetical protein
VTFALDSLERRTNATAQPVMRVPERYHLAGKVGYGLELVQALPVDVERDEHGGYRVSDPLFGVYGQGATEDDAFVDFSVSLVEYYEIMAQGVNPETRAVVDHLRTYLRPERSL